VIVSKTLKDMAARAQENRLAAMTRKRKLNGK
jgi:hypothetical protein